MKKIFIITGRTGAGKTTLCKKLKEALNYPLLTFASMGKSFANENGYNRIRECHLAMPKEEFNTKLSEYMLNILKETLNNCNSVIVDGLYMYELVKTLKKDYNCTIIYLELREKIRYERISQRLKVSLEEAKEENEIKEKLKDDAGIGNLIEEADYTINASQKEEEIFDTAKKIIKKIESSLENKKILKSKQQLIEDAFNLANETIPTTKEHIYIAFKKGEELAEIYKADKDIVKIGLYLMDVKLNEARKLGKKKEHDILATQFAREYLKDYDITKKEYNKIINCIEAHHKKVPYECIEAEICANADCYRFIHPKGVSAYRSFLATKIDNLEEITEKLSSKLEEKYKIISLDKVKEDLEKYIQKFRKMFDEKIKMQDQGE